MYERGTEPGPEALFSRASHRVSESSFEKNESKVALDRFKAGCLPFEVRNVASRCCDGSCLEEAP